MNGYKLVAVAAICSVLSCCSSGREGHVSDAPDVISMRVAGTAKGGADPVARSVHMEPVPAEAAGEPSSAALAAAEPNGGIASGPAWFESPQHPQQTITVTYCSLRWMFNSGLRPLRIVGSEGDLVYLSAPHNLVVLDVRTGRAGLIRVQSCRVVCFSPGRLIVYDGSVHYTVSFTRDGDAEISCITEWNADTSPSPKPAPTQNVIWNADTNLALNLRDASFASTESGFVIVHRSGCIEFHVEPAAGVSKAEGVSCVTDEDFTATGTWADECGTGRVGVTSDPEGADVVLNGERVGETPLELHGVPVGIHEICVGKPGYTTEQKSIVVNRGSRVTVDSRLDRSIGVLWERQIVGTETIDLSIHDGVVAIADTKTFHAYEADSGRAVGSHRLSGAHAATLIERYVVAAGGSRLRCYDAVTGEMRWDVDPGDEATGICSSNEASVLVSAGNAFVAATPERVVTYDEKTKTLSAYRMPECMRDRTAAGVGSPMIAEDGLLLCPKTWRLAGGAALYGLLTWDLTDEAVVQRVHRTPFAPTSVSAAPSGPTSFCLVRDCAAAMVTEDGTLKWECLHDDETAPMRSSLHVAFGANHIFIARADTVVVLERTDGRVAYRRRPPGDVDVLKTHGADAYVVTGRTLAKIGPYSHS